MKKFATRQECAYLKAKGSAQAQIKVIISLSLRRREMSQPLKWHFSLHFLSMPFLKQILHFGRK